MCEAKLLAQMSGCDTTKLTIQRSRISTVMPEYMC